MAKGKLIGEFSLKFTSVTLSLGPAGSVITQGNCEGPVTAFGTVLGTIAFVGTKTGTFSACWVAYLDDGEQRTGIGSGTFESSGKHRWRTQHVIQISDGTSVVNEGEIDLAARSWKGKNFENT